MAKEVELLNVVNKSIEIRFDKSSILALLGVTLLLTTLDERAYATSPLYASVSHDHNGVPLVYYGTTFGWQYNPITIAQDAMKHYSSFKKIGNQTDLALLKNESNWLVNNAEVKGNFSMLYYHFDFTRYNMSSPWRSGMAQGQALQALTEAYQATGNKSYNNAARLLLSSLYLSEADGGVTSKTSGQGWWYEEYADENGSNPRVLNGMMYTLVAIHEYYNYTNDPSAKFLFDQGIVPLTINLPQYDSVQNGSYYDALGKPASDLYHRVHITLLSQLYTITADPVIKEYRDKWNTWYVEHKATVTPEFASPLVVIISGVLASIAFARRTRSFYTNSNGK